MRPGPTIVLIMGSLTLGALLILSGDLSGSKGLSVVVGASIPVVNAGGLVNAASYGAQPPAAGSIAALFGTGMATATVTADTLPLPTTLGGSSVRVNGIAAPLFFVSPLQINLQLPWELAGQSQASVVVTVGETSSSPVTVNLSAIAPGIFTTNLQGTGPGAILHGADFQPVSETAPAQPGEFLLLFCTGLGSLRSPVLSGFAPPSPPPETVSIPQVTIADTPAEVTYSGLAPGFVGLYQVNVRVPPGLPSGTQSLQMMMGGSRSNAVTLVFSGGGGAVSFTHGVASGDVTSSSAVLWTRVDQPVTLTAEISPDAGFAGGVLSQALPASEGSDFTAKAEMSGLQPARTYYYRFRSENRSSPTGTFRTAPLPQTSADVRFAWSSDSDGSRVPPFNNFEVLDRAREDNLDFWVYLGDTAYMDTYPPFGTDLPTMRAKYKQNRSYAALRQLLAATSTYAIWDDHEVENDFAGQTVDPTLLANGRQAFREYMPIRDQATGLGFFRTFRRGKDVELFILDERSFRSGNVAAICQNDPAPTLPSASRVLLGLAPEPPPGCQEAINDPSRAMLGPAQRMLLESRLLQSDATWKIIINEVPITQLFVLPYDRWEGYAAERAQLLDFIRTARLTNVVFLTGDMHGNLMIQVRRNIFTEPAPIAKEVVAGPIAQTTFFRGLVGLVGSESVASSLVSLLTLVVQPECISLDTFAYGLVQVNSATKNLTITLKDQTGRAFCSTSLSPSS